MNSKHGEDELRQFLESYFHQDWYLDGAESWKEAISNLLRAHNAEAALEIRDSLARWVSEASPDAELPWSWDVHYDPMMIDGLTLREWVKVMAEYIGKRYEPRE